MNIKRTKSLKFKMGLALAQGALIALLLFFAISGLADFWIRESYLSVESTDKRKLDYVEELQDFVTENGLTSSAMGEISEWVTGKRWVSLTLYKDSELLFEYENEPPEDLKDLVEDVTSQDGENDGSLPPSEGTPGQMEEGTYTIRMTDGILLAVIDEHSDYYVQMVTRLSATLVAVIAFFAVVLRAFNFTTERILHLAGAVNRVGQGDLKLTIRDNGGDEISALASDVNRMRDSIVERMEKEQEAWQANTDLITAMSHDVRTPLTILMGYLDLIKSESDPEKIKKYAESCQETALRLKHLSDDLFRSFLVFQQTEESASMQSYDVTILFEQILAERTILLAEDGFSVESDIDVPPGTFVMADTNMLLRIIDNLSSNVGKYADPAEPIRVCLSAQDDRCVLTVTNREKKTTSHRQESTGIGLKSCAKLVACMGGTFTWRKEKDLFSAELSLTCPDEKE